MNKILQTINTIGEELSPILINPDTRSKFVINQQEALAEFREYYFYEMSKSNNSCDIETLMNIYMAEQKRSFEAKEMLFQKIKDEINNVH